MLQNSGNAMEQQYEICRARRTFFPAYLPRVMMATRPTLRNFILSGGVLSAG
jgi:hypothetical protein